VEALAFMGRDRGTGLWPPALDALNAALGEEPGSDEVEEAA
jgi:hypothetical protein